MLRWIRTAVALAAVAAAAACGMIADAQAPDAPIITREQFIVIYVGLRVAAAEATTRWDFEARKQALFDEHGVTPEALEAFLDAHRGDVSSLAAIWTEIERRLRETADRPE